MIVFNKIAFILFSGFTILLCSCGAKKDTGQFKNTSAYDFANPKILSLPKELDEISGITYYPKDTSVFAIIDEDGLLYKIPLKDPDNIKEWQFDKRRDYEDVVLKDSIFYVLVSNGDLEKLKFSGNNIEVEKIQYPDASKKVNEFESLYYDSATNKIVMLCKECEDDKKKQTSSYFLNDSTNQFEFYKSIESQPLFTKMGVEKEHIKPSAAAVNPVTNELYILCSVNKILIIEDSAGNLKDIIKLNPVIYKQPEGMAFTPNGDLIISNEFHDEGYGTLLLLKNKIKP